MTSQMIPADEAKKIPSRAHTVVLKSVLPADELYRTVQQKLDSLGYVVDDGDRAMYSLKTEFRRLEGGTQVRVEASVDDMGGFSLVRMSGEYQAGSSVQPRSRGSEFDMGNRRGSRSRSQGQTGPQEATWDGGEARRAFSEVVEVALTLPYASISYER